MKFAVICILIISFTAAGLGYQVYSTESQVAKWEDRVMSVERIEALNLQVTRAQDYARGCLSAYQTLAKSNAFLCDQSTKTVEYLTSLEEENRLLNASIKDAAKRMKKVDEENKMVRENNTKLHYKIMCLESVLRELPKKGSLKEALLNLLNIIMKDKNVRTK